MNAHNSNSNAILPNSARSWSVRKLDGFDYAQKLRHWRRDDPWNPDGERLYFSNTKVPPSAIKMKDGHIEKMPLLVGRPCFGIATAFLRYRDHVRYSKRGGVQPAGRCQRCKARDACASVVDRRLQSKPSITEAWIEWLKAGGPTAFRKPGFDKSLAKRLWDGLYRELARHPFGSVNDLAAQTEYERKDCEDRERDKKRQARTRMKARSEGIVDEFDLSLLEEAKNERFVALTVATLNPNCPKSLLRVPTTSVSELCDVWLGREILRLQKRKPNAPSIARWIADSGRRNCSANHAALATRVSKDLKRIDQFEQTEWEDSVLLPPLDISIELKPFPDGMINHENDDRTP